MTTEWMEKCSRTEALILQAERQLREVALDFGMHVAVSRRLRIDNICQELRESLQQKDDRNLDAAYANLQDALYDLNQEVRSYYSDDEDSDLLGTIRDLFNKNDEDDNELGGSPPIPSPRRPGPKPKTDDEAVLPPIDY